MFGITFRDIHSSELGAYWQTTSRPILPQPKLYIESAPSIDGSFDLSAFNADGRVHYEDRLHEGILSVVGLDTTDKNSKLSKVAAWLQGDYSYLVYDEMPYTAWFARVENIGLVLGELLRVGRATVYFRTKPFSTRKEVLLGDALLLSSENYIGGAYILGQASYLGDFAYNHTLDDGHFYSKPLFLLKPNWSVDDYTITLSASGQEPKVFTLNVPSPQAWVMVDFNILSITSETGDNLLGNSNAAFFEIPPGNFEISISSSNSSDIEMYLNLQYIYEVPL
ncbi:MAG: hypothetical protein WCQ41_09390 [Bacillota bacterium]